MDFFRTKSAQTLPLETLLRRQKAQQSDQTPAYGVPETPADVEFLRVQSGELSSPDRVPGTSVAPRWQGLRARTDDLTGDSRT